MTPSSCPYCAAPLTAAASRCAQCGAGLGGSAALKPGTRVGAYTLAHTLGQGGFGITYATSDPAVAVKEFYPDGLVTRGRDGRVTPLHNRSAEFTSALERFAREAQVLRALDHPGTTQYIAFWQENATAYLAMEYLDGESLETRISNGERLSEARARRAMLEILSLLEVVHAKGLLHRDIKPGNIVLTARRAELIDFGSATVYTNPKVTTRLLTPEYAPLEFYGSDVQLAPASDLYSLCATFYEAVTLQKPPSAIDRMNGTTVIPVRTLEPEVSAEFARVLETGLELRVEDRHQGATQLIQMLTKPHTRPPSSAPPAAGPAQRPGATGQRNFNAVSRGSASLQKAGATAVACMIVVIAVVNIFSKTMSPSAVPPVATRPTVSGAPTGRFADLETGLYKQRRDEIVEAAEGARTRFDQRWRKRGIQINVAYREPNVRVQALEMTIFAVPAPVLKTDESGLLQAIGDPEFLPALRELLLEIFLRSPELQSIVMTIEPVQSSSSRIERVNLWLKRIDLAKLEQAWSINEIHQAVRWSYRR